MICFRFAWALSLLLAVLLTCAPAKGLAQFNTAEISGVVADSQGGVLPGTTVTARHVLSGMRVERISDAEGRFFMPALSVGEYAFTATLSGFKQYTLTSLVLQVGQKLNMMVVLEVGPISESVSVSAEAPL